MAIASSTQGTLLPEIQRQVLHLTRHCVCLVQPLSVGSGAPPNDRFMLELPFASQLLQWQVVYQRVGVQWVPDFIFSGTPEFQPLDEGTGGAAARAVRDALQGFDVEQAGQLLALVRALLESYAAFMRTRLQRWCGDNQRLAWELETSAQHAGTQLALAPGADGGPDKVWFCLPLPRVSLGPLLPFLLNTWDPLRGSAEAALQRLQSTIKLNAVFSCAPGKSAAPELQLDVPSELQRFVGHVALPPFDGGSCLVEYLPEVAERLQGAVVSAGEGVRGRSTFLQALMAALGRPLELDTIHARAASFVVTHEATSFVVCFNLVPAFPQEQPKVVLQVHQPSPDLVIYSEYPWSPRWASEEMAARVVAFVRDEMAKWKLPPAA